MTKIVPLPQSSFWQWVLQLRHGGAGPLGLARRRNPLFCLRELCQYLGPQEVRTCSVKLYCWCWCCVVVIVVVVLFVLEAYSKHLELPDKELLYSEFTLMGGRLN